MQRSLVSVLDAVREPETATLLDYAFSALVFGEQIDDVVLCIA